MLQQSRIDIYVITQIRVPAKFVGIVEPSGRDEGEKWEPGEAV